MIKNKPEVLLELTDNDKAMIKKSDSSNFTTPFHYSKQSKPVQITIKIIRSANYAQ